MMYARNGMRPVHPGEVLREELNTIGMSANALSKELGVPVNRITMILNGQRGVTADTALRRARTPYTPMAKRAAPRSWKWASSITGGHRSTAP